MAANYYSCLFRSSLFPWVVVLGFFFAFAHSSEIGFLTIILTSSALVLSPVIVSRSKPSCSKECCPRTILSEDVLSLFFVSGTKTSCSEERPRTISSEDVVSDHNCEANQVTNVTDLSNRAIDFEEAEEKSDNDNNAYLLSSSDVLSDSECHDQTSSSSDECFENDDWIFRDNVSSHQPESFSDGSISDEESLIEIALPTGHYLEPIKRCSDYWSLESRFTQQNLMEMLSEENLIEIDICMGSIKCSRFGIQA
ncbi:hypothetical protein vseg_017797 [Gypsophila vaccaria]